MNVKNINGTLDTKCSCGSWLQHWENYSNQSAKYCSEKSCIKKELVGAHVQKANSTDNKWYIVPLCDTHNKATIELELAGGAQLVSANKKETCEKNN